MDYDKETNILDILAGIFFFSLIISLSDIALNWEFYSEVKWFISKTMISIIIGWYVIGIFLIIIFIWVWISNYTVISRDNLKELKELGKTK